MSGNGSEVSDNNPLVSHDKLDSGKALDSCITTVEDKDLNEVRSFPFDTPCIFPFVMSVIAPTSAPVFFS